MPEFERLYVKIIGDSNLDKTVDKDTKTLTAFQKKLDGMFRKYKDQKVTVEVDEDGGAETTAQLAEVTAAAEAVPNQIEMNVDVDAGSALTKIGALRAATIGSGGLTDGFLTAGAAARSTFTLAIPAAIGLSIAALAPLIGGAAAGGGVVAGVAGGFGLMALAGKEAFGKLQTVNGKFVAKTSKDAHSTIGTMATYINKVVENYEKAIQPASYAFAGFTADVLRDVNKTIPYIGTIATKTTKAVHAAFNSLEDTAFKGPEIASFKRLAGAMPKMSADFTKALGALGAGLVNILGQSTPYAKMLSHWITRIMQDFQAWTESTAGREKMHSFFEAAAKLGPVAAKAIGHLAWALINVSTDPSTQDFLAALLRLIDNIAQGKGAIGGFEKALVGIVNTLNKLNGFDKNHSVWDENFWKMPEFHPDKSVVGRFFGWISNTAQKALKMWRDRFANKWDDIQVKWEGSGLQNLYQNIVHGTQDVLKRVSSILRDLGSNMRNIFGGILKIAGNLWDKISKRVISNSDDAKSGSGDRFRDLENNAKAIWNRVEGTAQSLWSKISDRIKNNSEDAKIGSGKSFRNLEDNAKAIWNRVESTASSVWHHISDTVRGLAWDIYHGVSDAWHALEDFVMGVLKRLGIGSGSGSSGSSGSSGGSSGGGSPKPFVPVGKARGGLESGKYHGMARGGVTDRPRVVYGEAGPEAYVTLGRYTPESANALRTANEMWAKKGWLDRADRLHGGGHAGMDLAQRAQKGTDTSGATSHNWVDWVRKYAYETVNAVGGISVNTYANHGGRGLWGEQHSVDHWGPGGRGAPVGTSKGNEVVSHVTSKYGKDIMYYIWQGIIHGWGTSKHYSDPNDQHFDHVHVTYDKGGSGGLGAGSSGPSWQETLFEKGWNATAQPLLDHLAASMQGGFVLRQAAAGLSNNAGTSVHDTILQWIRDKFGGGSGSSSSALGGDPAKNRALGEQMFKSSGLKGSFSSLDSLWMRESGWDRFADNPTSTAYGIPQNINPSTYPPGGSKSQGSHAGPQISWGLNYIRSRYGSTDKAWQHSQSTGWYERGGVIPGPKGKPVMIQAHSGERVLPVEVVRSFDNLATSIKRWAAHERASFNPDGNLTGDDLRDEVRQLRKEFVDEVRALRKQTPDAETLLHMALRVQDSPAGMKGAERRVGRIVHRELKKVG